MVKKINKFLIISEAIVLLLSGIITVSAVSPGCLEITKTVNWNGVDPIDGQTFEICITGPSYPDGNCKTFTYPDHLVLEWCNLLPGEYTVAEIYPGDEWTVEITDSPAVVPHGGYAYASVTNTRKLGYLEVTKNVNWNGVDPIDGQTFEICITGPSYPDGNCKTFTFPDHLFKIWYDLIPGDYTISETNPGDMWIVCGDGVTVSIPTDGCSASAEITNTYKIPEGCTLTLGYWKTHSEYGPAPYDDTWAELPDGADTEFFGTDHTYYEILNMDSKGGNAYIILAHQYIAAELNGLNNDDPLPSHIMDIMGDAESLLICYQCSLEIPKGNPDRSYAITLAGDLDGFNNGRYPGWFHCEDD